jgi:hypothetical protein
MSWILVLFYGGLLLAVTAQIINFLTGEWNWRRGVGIGFGIAAALAIAAAGRLTSNEIRHAAQEAKTAANNAAGFASFVNAYLSRTGL